MSLAFLAEMGWKSALISAVALLLVTLLRKRSAADRAALLRVGVVLLLLLPVITLALPALEVETAVAPVSAAVETDRLPVPSSAELAGLPVAPVEPSLWDRIELLAALAYAAGLLLIAMRFGIGLLTLRRWTKAARKVTSGAWTAALDRRIAAGSPKPLLLASDEVSSPMSWGLRQPVILLDRDALARPEDADAILAHELAHVARRDWVTLIMARAAVALFWFNPLVWLLEREVVQHAEEAADSHALVQVEPAFYAQTLVTCAKHYGRARVPANSIAASGGGLRRRVKAILDGTGRSTPSGSRWTFAAMIGCMAIAAPVAALQLVSAPPTAPVAPMVPAAPTAPLAPSVPMAAAMVSAVHPPTAPAAPQQPAKTHSAGHVEIDIDEEAIEGATERAAERAEAQAERIEELAERAAEQAERAAEHAEREGEHAAKDGERIAWHASRIAAEANKAADHARKAGVIAMRKGADEMMRGADEMERGARQMEQEAVKLRDPAYRRKQIAENARRGHVVTDRELIAAIPKMKKGAEEMREGAVEMRQGAAQMHRQGL